MSTDHAFGHPTTTINTDLIERLIVVLLYSFFVWRMLGSFLETGSIVTFLYLLNESAVVAFVLVRRRARVISERPRDWITGFGGTCLSLLLIPPSGAPILPLAVCAALMLLGVFVQLIAKFTLRRSFGIVAANRGVKLSGPYLVVRHPMYAGYMIAQLSLLLAGPNLSNLVIVAVVWSLQVLRLLAEERVLQDDPAYRDLMARTRYRLLPGVF